jgi:hypothetical protein
MGITRRHADNLANEISSLETKIYFFDPNGAKEARDRIRCQAGGSMRRRAELLYAHLHSLNTVAKLRVINDGPAR